jgi:ubiquinone/menaquinone biosynthesis C-methylase UbiE
LLYSTAIAEERDWTQVAEDPTLKVLRWTEDVIDAETEMQEWVSPVVERLRKLSADRVLEIGCGTGLLLFELAPQCSKYVGTDYSEVVLHNLEARLKNSSIDPKVAELLHRPADNFDVFEEHSFDLVIIHSVVQYFPNMEYLKRVIDGAVKLVKNGGSIFIGDVQNFALLETFHTESILNRIKGSVLMEALRQKIRKRVEIESELTIDPGFFVLLEEQMSRIENVNIQLRRGRIDNEPTKYHYDVMLHVGENQLAADAHEWVSWDDAQLTLELLGKQLENSKPQLKCLSEIPNARIRLPVEARRLVTNEKRMRNVDELREALRSVKTGIHPEDIISLGAALGYEVETRWSADGSTGHFDAVLSRIGTNPHHIPHREKPLPGAMSDFGNNPADKLSKQNLSSDVRKYLSGRLPDYMVPAFFVILDKLPLSPNGKVDRKALPEPDASMLTQDRAYDPPTNEQEAALAEIWAKVLKLERVGINDDVFELGGDSLLIFQIVTRATHSGFPIKPKQIFEHRTISRIVDALGANGNKTENAAAPRIERISRGAVRFQRSGLES